MKLAQTPDGKLVEATVAAPKEAICPHCGGTLKLRSRRAMNNGKASYYWRHRSNQNRNCSGRQRPIG
jgi:hypothetical protein